MKKVHYLITLGVLMFGTSIIFSGCSKKSSTPDTIVYPTPAFSVTFDTIALPTGESEIEFFAKCTTTDIKMTKVEISDSISNDSVTYDLKNITHLKNEVFPLQDAGVHYIIKGGGYQITFTGTRVADNATFTAVSRLNITVYPTPEFNVTYVLVTLQSGDSGVEFFAECTTTDVKMTKVEIVDPLTTGTITYNLNGMYFVKDQIFTLQDNNTAYLKEVGIWQFTFIGKRTIDNRVFNFHTTLNVSK